MTDDAAAPRVRGLGRLTGSAARHPRRTILVWVLTLVTLFAAAATMGGTLTDEFRLPGSESQRATDLLADRFPAQAGDSAQMVLATESGRLDAGAARAAVEDARAAAARVPGVVAVGDPFAGESGGLSPDGRVAYADVRFDRVASAVPDGDLDRLQEDVRAAVGGVVRAEFGGPMFQSEGPGGVAELIGLAVAVVILVLMLGSFVAMGVPIVFALMSVAAGSALILLWAAVQDVASITTTLAVMIGLGVGIDYALFVVTRFRQALHDGRAPRDAAAEAGGTAGRAVVFAGVTVAVSIAALALLGIEFMTLMGIGAAITVMVAVAASVTLLPAVLALIGHRIDRGRPPFMRQPDDSEAARERTAVARLGRAVVRRPRIAAAASLAVLVALALPVAGVQLGSSDAGAHPAGSTTREAYDLLSDGFGPGFNGPVVIAVDQSGDPGAAALVARAASADPGVAQVAPPVANATGDTAVVTVVPATAPQDAATRDLLERLRGEVVPGALDGSPARAYVGGPTAVFDDIAAQVAERLPVFLLAIVGIIALLIAMAFRSVVVALKAAVTSLLSALAAFGVLVAVFQEGWFAGPLGVDSTGPIESFLPAVMFAILIGLSTDYEVFIMSRIREEHAAGRGARESITHGVAAIGRVVVAAALIMGSVFLSFMLEDDRVITEFGLGLGAAILIDALLVRLVLVPAVMAILGERAWYMPAWLDRVLPRLTIEPPAVPVHPTPAAAGASMEVRPSTAPTGGDG